MTAPTVIVVPCYNEASRLDTERVAAFAVRPGASLLCVDDGSTDATARLLEELAARSAGRVGVLRLTSNRGKANAVRAGRPGSVWANTSADAPASSSASVPMNPVRPASPRSSNRSATR